MVLRSHARKPKQKYAGTRPPRWLQEDARRLLREHHAADGHHHQTVLEDTTGHEVTLRSHLRHSHHGYGARRREEQEGTEASVQRGSSGSWQRPHTGPTSDLRMGRFDRGSPEAGSSDSDRLLEAARRHEHGHEVRPCEVLQGRSDMPVRTSSHHSVCRKVRRTRPSRERVATVGSSTQVRQSTANPAVSRSQQWLDTLLDKWGVTRPH